MKTLLTALLGISVLFFFAHSLSADEPKRDGSLLMLKDIHSKGGKVQGRAWYVAQSGEYEVVSFGDANPILLKSGKLDKNSVDDLIAYLDYRRMDALPTNLGSLAILDRHEMILRRGSQDHKRLRLAFGQSLENAELEYYAKWDSPASFQVDRFASIVKTIKSLCSE